MALNRLPIYISNEPEDQGAIACSNCGEFGWLKPTSASISKHLVVVVSFHCSFCNNKFSFKIGNDDGTFIEAVED
jgi:hypothetical protein